MLCGVLLGICTSVWWKGIWYWQQWGSVL